MIKTSTHPLDHLVLPTLSLEVARQRLSALGFVVAPTGIHPFGTENACVFFADGTYLEPLAVGDEKTARQAIGEGNVFVARDRLFRNRLGDEGFSAVVFGTPDAGADHARYVEAGLSAGDMLSFSRAFTDAAGKSDTASFKLAFVADRKATDAFLFACQRINAPEIDRTALQAHANGVTGVVEVVAVSDSPSSQAGLVSTAAGRDTNEGDKVELPNATLTVLTPGSFASRFGVSARGPSDLRFAAIVFSTRSTAGAAHLLAANAIEHNMSGSDIVVPSAPGQGAAFIFREIP
ncbi:VOC family protein [Mesorhizobium sp. M1C.F.Ca.ET.193.01.1.1]|uniref:VOC family protein n=1 Tax=unclassified Mesorhizobium TaxID=325217 RepID=UPI000FD33323|nr:MULTISPECIES: VOC family protein [unclassified Mesorhizobium]TGT03383.1 VOC family protein [bacterium M00.F.Ca.ET.177.01.1.1]TGQ56065.1 VOC family protein [Mesorhizobium sp. M1C.F.Ca.ET.210.01.1.1]TGQ75150.1 VOC family protein [Mesorhizobium sp. M1C.F.Ca.ET.212.01.1.1]TGR13562.1 VOC family protein [Mesorhizobium sp. M1C.F.Ca.ET.204.01.1.1]TGR33838.1 VOC family protein [Mesorhizobium sp. M1C.F.Ca.ET.196.01.1.1]